MTVEPLFSARLHVPGVDLSGDPAAYVVDGMRPSVVAAPASQEDVASVLAIAQEVGAAVIPRGGGTHMGLGMPPERYDLALDLRRLDRVVEYEPADLTVTVEAGMPFAELQRVLGEQGQWLPLDPPCEPGATVGGVLATNASGPARHSRGTARDLVIGMTFATAEGALVKSGGRVVKNVAGYDLAKLQIGALGTLGVITQATFKVSPLPVMTKNLWVGGTFDQICSLARDLGASQMPVQGLVMVQLLQQAPGWNLEVRFAGGKAAVERAQAELEETCAASSLVASVATDGAQRRSLWIVTAPEPLVRASVPQSAVYESCPAFVEAGAWIVIYPTAGVIFAGWPNAPSSETIAELRQRCLEAGGALVIERAPAEVKRAAGVWGETRGDFALMQRLKSELDPGHVLNPGRFVGGI